MRKLSVISPVIEDVREKMVRLDYEIYFAQQMADHAFRITFSIALSLYHIHPFVRSRAPRFITHSPYAGFTRDSRCRISGSAPRALPVDRSHSSAAE